jgi:uncharacterized protein (DUF1810 family)
MSTEDPFNLQRFVDAQAGVYAAARAELEAGRKRSHWMWFIFPQIRGLGSSPTAQRFAITSREEAAAYLAHPVLGPNLHECVTLVNAIDGRSISAIFSSPDDLKFHSSVTLFANATAENAIFLAALEKYFSGKPDQATLGILRHGAV